MSLRDLRSDYLRGQLSEDTAGNDPVRLMQDWLDAAIAADVPEPNAMTLATVNAEGQPSSRIVLLRGFGQDGVEFYTNYLSRKGEEITGNPSVALQFFWPTLERQVRIEGLAEKLSPEESDEYFNRRPFETRLGAVASQQSRTLPDRDTLDAAVEQLRRQYADQRVPRPQHWGGYRVRPHAFEFWQGRKSRLHDRLLFTLSQGQWHRCRLWP